MTVLECKTQRIFCTYTGFYFVNYLCSRSGNDEKCDTRIDWAGITCKLNESRENRSRKTFNRGFCGILLNFHDLARREHGDFIGCDVILNLVLKTLKTCLNWYPDLLFKKIKV